MTEDVEYCAEVLVDLSSRIEDRPLTYRVPPALRSIVGVGVRALVPLGPRTVSGFILAVHPCAGSMTRPLREILDVPDATPLFSEALLALARWVADETLSTLLDALRCLVPPEVRRGRAAPAWRSQIATLVRVDTPAAVGQEASRSGSRRRPRGTQDALATSDHGGRLPGRAGQRQARILALLQASPGGVLASDIVRLAGRSAFRRLVARGVVRLSPAQPFARAHASLPACPRGDEADPQHRGPGAPAAQPTVAASPPTASTGGVREACEMNSLPLLLWGDAEARMQWMIQAAATEVRRGRQVLITVPEITHTSALIDRLRHTFGEAVLAYHSDLPPAQHRTIWWRIHAGGAGVVVGTRSALFAHFPRLGLIIVDEEQDPSYKADAAPRYHGRDVAVYRGKIEGIPVVLGSAAPSLETYAGVASDRVRCVRLASTRAEHVVVVDMRAERREGRGGVLSRPLVEAIHRHLRAGGRAALLVNRLGYARVLLCQECGHAVRCPRCDIALPYDKQSGTIQCRVCGYAASAPEVCPRCRGIALRWVGAGTRRVEEILHRLFPAVGTARVDRESAPAWDVLAREAASGRIRLVVGTQLLLRGREFRPSLIGVVDADGPLYRPDFRAVERAFQQLRAAIALAGASPGPEAVVQTRVPDHPVLAVLRTGEDVAVYESELRVRREFGYPPYAHLARVIASSQDLGSAHELASRAAEIARTCGVDVLGPAPDPHFRGRPPFRVECLLRSSARAAVRDAARSALDGAVLPRGSRLTVDIDPQEMH